jgi:hypothetical protein
MWFLLLTVALAPTPVQADSAAHLREARDAQARFERLRVHHAPWGRWSSGGACDEQVGRFCLRFTSERQDEPTPPFRPPPEAEAVERGRAALDSVLFAASRAHPGDAWVAGQLTWYRGDAGEWEAALEAARACRSPEPGWCDFLEGFALHGAGRIAESESRFRRALDALPDEERRRLVDPEWIVETDVARELRRRDGEARDRLVARIWALGNPLELAGGNALLTEHLSRHTAARIQADARNPYGLRWGDDMTELLVRFGAEVGWERARETTMVMGPPSVTGRFSGDAKGVLPGLEALLDPASAGGDAYPAASFRARSRHALPGFERVRGMDARVSRFLRGDSVLIVAAWRVPGVPAWDSVPPLEVSEGALFLMSEADGWRPRRFPLEGAREGVATALASQGDQVLSLELADPAGRRGWRFRRGIARDAGTPGPGEVGFSDLLLLRPETPAPTSPAGEAPPATERLEDHLHRALPSDTLEAGPVEVAWEVYGRPAGEERLPLVLSVERGERGLLRRAAEALRILSPVDPVQIRWEEGSRDGDPGAVPLRRIRLELGDLAPGSWILTLSLPLGDGTMARTTTQIVIR